MDNQKKILKLCDYLRQVAGLRQRTVKNIRDEAWVLPFSELPVDPKRIHQYNPGEDLPEGAPEGLLLEVEKPEFTPCPDLPFDLLGWVKTPGWRHYDVAEVEMKEERPHHDPRLKESVTERFEDSGVRLAAFEDWKRHRNLWRAGEMVKGRTRKLFLDLYEIYDRLRQDPERLELIIGNACFLNCLDTEVEHPLLLKKVRLHYDPQGKMQLLETEGAAEIYTELLQDLPGIEGEGIRALDAMVDEADMHPLAATLAEFLAKASGTLTPRCRFTGQKTDILPSDWYLFYLKPVLFLRRHNAGTAQAIAALAEEIEQGGEVPQALLEIVDPDCQPAKVVLPDEDVETRLADARGEAEDILLVKPANAEQLAIVRELEQASAVVVQGPPGTGKTHTIANLLGHYLAQGQHVLVTSQASKALSVLKDKLPEGLQHLCVSLLGDSRKDMEKSVAGICEMLSRHSADELQAEAEALGARRHELLSRLSKVRGELDMVRRLEGQRDYFTLGAKTWSLSRMSDYLYRHAELDDRLPKPIKKGMPFPLKAGELAELYQLNEVFTEESLREMGETLPDSRALMAPSLALHILKEEGAWQREVADLLTGLPQAACSVAEGLTVNGQPVAEEFSVERFREAVECYQKIDFAKLNQPWAKAAVLAGWQGGAHREVWEMLGRDVARVQQLKAQSLKQFFGRELKYTLKLPLGQELMQQLSELAEAFDASGQLSWWTRMRHSELAKLQKGFTIDGRPLADRNDCQLAMQYVALAMAREQVRREWEQLLVPLGVEPYEALARPGEDLDDICSARWRELIQYLDWYKGTVSELKLQLARAGLKMELLFKEDEFQTPQARLNQELEWLEHGLLRWLRLCALRYVEREGGDRLAPTRLALQKASGALADRLSAAVETFDSQAYAGAFEQLRRYEELRPRYLRRQELFARLQAAAPRWADEIHRQAGRKVEPPAEAESAWIYEQMRLAMAGVPAVEVEALAAEVQEANESLSRVTLELTEKLAWQHLLAKVSGGSLQASLIGWSKAVGKIGRGRGKYAARHIREARECMLQAQAAVPAWIMPLERVWQNLRPDSPKFDIIIMDEASQADILALPLLYFAKKAIIVGDDKQVSPADIGIRAEELLGLQAATIEGVVSHAALYTMDTSLYDLAQMHFSARLLTEHFRSVPEIIGYSNRLCYEGRIQPLREAGSSALVPVVDWLAEGEREGKAKRNPGEAEEIVAILAACFEQPEYQDKTFGAISLLGDEQPKLIRELAIEKLGITVLEQHGFLSGTPAYFQGDERDVVLLSLVDSAGAEDEGQLRLVGEGRGADRLKRYNVAVSRARDQLWVVHSMEAGELKEGDLRRGLLEYAREPASVISQVPEGEATSLESAVARALRQAGFTVHLRYAAGGGRLGLVVSDGVQRAAVDCEGERWYGLAEAAEEQRREAVLQRLGWRFLRLRGSVWYLEPQQALQKLIVQLAALGIKPHAQEHEAQESWEAQRAGLQERVAGRARELLREWRAPEPLE